MILKVLGWLCIPFVMLGILIKKKTNNVKAGVTVGLISFIVWSVIVSTMSNDDKAKGTTNSANPTSVVTKNNDKTASNVQTVKPTAKPTLSPKEKAKIKKEKEEKKFNEWTEGQFSAWDGSHTVLVDLIKENMNDPDSFEHEDTRYSRKSYGLYIIMKYRGTNAFGGVVTNYVTAQAFYKTNTIKIIPN